jgi:hypothetical protein
MVGEGLRMGIKSWNQGWGVKTLTGISMLEAERRGAVRRGGGVAGIDWCGVGDEADGHGSDVWERRHNCQNAQTQRKDTVASGVKWAGVGEAGPDPRRKFRRDLIFEIQMNLDFGKTLRISIRRFRRNLGMGIFPKFF